jgi:hypothetical protein
MNQGEDIPHFLTALARQQPNVLIGMRRFRSFIANLGAYLLEMRTSLMTHLPSSREMILLFKWCIRNSEFSQRKTVMMHLQYKQEQYTCSPLRNGQRSTLPASTPCGLVDLGGCAVDYFISSVTTSMSLYRRIQLKRSVRMRETQI